MSIASVPVQVAELSRLGADDEGFGEDARASRAGELARIAIDIDERDAFGRLEVGLSSPASARVMNAVQMGSAAVAPLSPSGWLSSSPTHTTVTSSGVNPTNHASRRSLVVPVLPAASGVKPAARALTPPCLR